MSQEVARSLVRDHLTQVCRWTANPDHYHALPGVSMETLRERIGDPEKH